MKAVLVKNILFYNFDTILFFLCNIMFLRGEVGSLKLKIQMLAVTLNS